MFQSDAPNTTTAPLDDSANVATSPSAPPVIDLDPPGMPIPSREEFMRQAGVIYDGLATIRPLLSLGYADVVFAVGNGAAPRLGLGDHVEMATVGANWARALLCLFETGEEHLQWAAGDLPGKA